MERPAETPVLRQTYPAVAGSVASARAAVVDLVGAAGASEEQIDKIALAASEGLTNVVKHAYPGGPGSIYLEAAVAGGELWVLIADDGCGLREHSHNPGLGLGLMLMAELSDHFAVVERSGGGIEVRMRFTITDGEHRGGRQSRGSVTAATCPASPTFSTTT
jgi:anti-sigma regulatory factor (Ser/Thr protein kinase)